jgi:uncharacterized protein
MKYLLLAAVLVIAYLLWRNARIGRDASPPGRRPQAGTPQEMVSCPVCGVHLPRGEALIGRDGQPYCSHEHRLRSGG